SRQGTPATQLCTLSLHDALPIYLDRVGRELGELPRELVGAVERLRAGVDAQVVGVRHRCLRRAVVGGQGRSSVADPAPRSDCSARAALRSMWARIAASAAPGSRLAIASATARCSSTWSVVPTRRRAASARYRSTW